MQGPAASVRLGKEAQLITLPKQLLMYHSPVAARLLANSVGQTDSNSLDLRGDSPIAFAHICRWMYQDELVVVPPSTSTSDRSSWQDACTLLCLVYFTARRLEISAVQKLVLMELRRIFTVVRESGYRTPVTPSTVLAVWEEGGAECELWDDVLEEMCVAFSTKPRAVFAEYDVCFEEIKAFRTAVGGAMSDAIEVLQVQPHLILHEAGQW